MKFCITCRFYEESTALGDVPVRLPGHCANDVAIAASTVNPVDGRLTRAALFAASDMRIHGPCGMAGKYWERMMT